MAATTLSVALATFTVPMPMPKTPRWQGIYATVLAIVAFDPLVAIGLLPYYLGISVGRVLSGSDHLRRSDRDRVKSSVNRNTRSQSSTTESAIYLVRIASISVQLSAVSRRIERAARSDAKHRSRGRALAARTRCAIQTCLQHCALSPAQAWQATRTFPSWRIWCPSPFRRPTSQSAHLIRTLPSPGWSAAIGRIGDGS